ncbi:MAG: hypothetical protein WBV94_13965 [Blastocatellia bacterium]
MKLKRTFACPFIVAAFPLPASQDQSNAALLAMVALASHTNPGGGTWCECGCARCICDPVNLP